jgi:adenylate cyclase
LLDAFCKFLNAEGFAVRRCNLATETIHPLMTGSRYVWYDEAIEPGPLNPSVIVARRQYRVGAALIDEVFFNSGSQHTAQYLASPFYQVELHGELFAHIGPPGVTQPYPVFDDLAAIGCTSYFGLKLVSFADMLNKISLATARPGGLELERCDDLRWSLRLLALHIDTLIESNIKNTLARVYVGRDPGQRVCDGMISVGALVSLDAAIWFSDLRGFTSISESLSSEELVEGLNSYFEVVVGAIYAHGGEVLKYIGDAILAVFPVASFSDNREACEAALAAARSSTAALVDLNELRARGGAPAFTHGVGLHLGKAQYGNIGSKERLDFTVIGREVNLASRVEGLCKETGEEILCSGALAECCAGTRSLGSFALKGFGEPVLIHAAC